MQRRLSSFVVPLVVASVAASAFGAAGDYRDCDITSVGKTPINDLGPGLYLDLFEGGLYPGGVNTPPAAHDAEGRARAAGIRPLDADGSPDPDGKYVLLSIGMSNATLEFCSQRVPPCNPGTFMDQAASHPGVDHESLVIANGAISGEIASSWRFPDQQNYDRVRDEILVRHNVTEAQVVAVWLKNANPGPYYSLPSESADAYTLMSYFGDAVRACRVRYPNLRFVFLSSRTYAGYSTHNLNPEPYAHESAFSVKWLVEAQIRQVETGEIDPRAGGLDYESGVAPWIGWAAYPWADGLVPRSDGLIWECTDVVGDGVHPSDSGRTKVGTLLLDFFLNSPYTRAWFAVRSPGDVDDDGDVDFQDLLALLASWGPCPTHPGASSDECPADIDGDGVVGIGDLITLLAHWGP